MLHEQPHIQVINSYFHQEMPKWNMRHKTNPCLGDLLHGHLPIMVTVIFPARIQLIITRNILSLLRLYGIFSLGIGGVGISRQRRQRVGAWVVSQTFVKDVKISLVKCVTQPMSRIFLLVIFRLALTLSFSRALASRRPRCPPIFFVPSGNY